MNTRMVIALVTLALGVAACGNGTEPEREFGLSFNIVPADTIVEGDTVIFTRGQLGALPELRPIRVEAREGMIHVFGSYATPCTDPAPTAELERSGDMIALIVVFQPAEVCATAPRGWTYVAHFTSVPTGTYQLQIKHYEDQLRPDGVILEQQVQVP